MVAGGVCGCGNVSDICEFLLLMNGYMSNINLWYGKWYGLNNEIIKK